MTHDTYTKKDLTAVSNQGIMW